MPVPVISVVAAVVLLALAVYKYLLVPIFLSPLARIPNAHWSAPLAPFWILFHRQQQNETFVVHAAHARLGPVIRLAPNEISVNSVDGGIRTIYGGGFEKGDWYSNVFSNYGVPPMFAMEEHGPHSKRKRMLSNIYAKSTLQTSPALSKITTALLTNRLLPRLRGEMESSDGIEFFDIFYAVVADYVSNYIFGAGNGSDFIRNRAQGVKFFQDYKARQKYTFWPQEMPRFTKWMNRLRLRRLFVPSWVDGANFDIEAWIMSMCDAAEKTLQAFEAPDAAEGSLRDEDYPTVYAQLRNALVKDASKSDQSRSKADIVAEHRRTIASELLDHTLAGFDTSGITLTWLAWELSRPINAAWQARLRAEIATLPAEEAGRLDAKAIDALPVLHAIVMETLRLHTAIPGNQPRVTPAGATTTLGDAEAGVAFADLPPHVRVQAQAWSLHRNARVFPAPETWDPARWLEAADDAARKRDMARWFWAFGSGGRMCVGSNLAMLDMKATVVGVWGRFRTDVADDRGMVHNGGYTAEPLGVGSGGKKGVGEGRKFLLLKLREVDETKA